MILWSPHRTLAALALLAGVLALFAGSPYRGSHAQIDVGRLAAAVAHEEDHVTAVELAQWIKDRKPRLHVIDLRPASEYDDYHIPGAERVELQSIAATSFPAQDTLVLCSGGGAHAAQAWVFLQALGYRNVYFLRGGISEWIEEVMNPAHMTDLSRYFGGTPRITNPNNGKATSWRRGC